MTQQKLMHAHASAIVSTEADDMLAYITANFMRDPKDLGLKKFEIWMEREGVAEATETGVHKLLLRFDSNGKLRGVVSLIEDTEVLVDMANGMACMHFNSDGSIKDSQTAAQMMALSEEQGLSTPRGDTGDQPRSAGPGIAAQPA